MADPQKVQSTEKQATIPEMQVFSNCLASVGLLSPGETQQKSIVQKDKTTGISHELGKMMTQQCELMQESVAQRGHLQRSVLALNKSRETDRWRKDSNVIKALQWDSGDRGSDAGLATDLLYELGQVIQAQIYKGIQALTSMISIGIRCLNISEDLGLTSYLGT